MLKEVKGSKDLEACASSAAMLQDAVAAVTEGVQTPQAVFVQIFWKDGQLTRFRNVEVGFNILSAIGAFEYIQADLIDQIRINS